MASYDDPRHLVAEHKMATVSGPMQMALRDGGGGSFKMASAASGGPIKILKKRIRHPEAASFADVRNNVQQNFGEENALVNSTRHIAAATPTPVGNKPDVAKRCKLIFLMMIWFDYIETLL